jgi:multicomponent Na+:H+ antiporter subunit C
MSAIAIAVFLLATAGIYLALGRRRFEKIVGLSLLAHAANLAVLAASARVGAVPALHAMDGAPIDAETIAAMADPLPQAMVLTAVVISMALTLYLLALLVADRREADRDRARTGGQEAGSPEPAP